MATIITSLLPMITDISDLSKRGLRWDLVPILPDFADWVDAFRTLALVATVALLIAAGILFKLSRTAKSKTGEKFGFGAFGSCLLMSVMLGTVWSMVVWGFGIGQSLHWDPIENKPPIGIQAPAQNPAPAPVADPAQNSAPAEAPAAEAPVPAETPTPDISA